MAKKGGNPNGNPQYLTPFNEMDPERAREIRAKGNKAYAENCKKRKALKEELLLLLAQGDTQKNISLAIIQKAMNGDTKAFEVIRDTIGEKPTDKQEIKVVETDWFVE